MYSTSSVDSQRSYSYDPVNFSKYKTVCRFTVVNLLYMANEKKTAQLCS